MASTVLGHCKFRCNVRIQFQPISGTGVVAPPPPPVTPFPVAAFSVIYSFPYQSSLSGPWAYGVNPEAGLVQGVDGDFYGSTIYGGSFGYGVIFRMNAAGSNQLLYSFPADDSHGGAPGGTVDAGKQRYFVWNGNAWWRIRPQLGFHF